MYFLTPYFTSEVYFCVWHLENKYDTYSIMKWIYRASYAVVANRKRIALRLDTVGKISESRVVRDMFHQKLAVQSDLVRFQHYIYS